MGDARDTAKKKKAMEKKGAKGKPPHPPRRKPKPSPARNRSWSSRCSI